MNKKARIEKVVSQLPSTLQKNTVYYVRVGNGFDIYVTNDSGFIVAYPANYTTIQTSDNKYFPRNTDTTSVIDLNTQTLEGVYYGYQWLNAPVSTIATLTVKIYSPDWIRQEYSPIDGSGTTYVRDRYSGTTWGDWKIIANRDWVLANSVTLTTEQNIEGAKWFITSGGSTFYNHKLRVLSSDGSNPGIGFYKNGVNNGTIQYDGTNYLFTTSDTNAFANLASAGYIKEGSNDGYVLTGGGGHKAVSDFATQDFINGNFHKTDPAFGINNGSDSRPNKTWFDYDWAGIGYQGSVINFSGFSGADQRYSTELFGEYNNGGNVFGFRTRNGDAGGIWNPVRLAWHNGNFNPAQYVKKTDLNTQLGNYATLNGTQTFSGTNTFPQNIIIPFYPTLLNHAASYGFVADYVDGRESVIMSTVASLYVNRLENATGLGFDGGTPDAPYVQHINGTKTRVSSETWTANNFASLNGNQTLIGENTFDKSPKVPFATEPDGAVPLNQTEEIAQTRINDTFFEIIYKNSATDLTFDFNDYPNAKVVTIACKGNNFQNIRIENMPRSVTLKIMNGSASLSPTIYFDGGTIATGLGNATWCGFYRDQDSDIFKNNVNGTNII